MAAFTADPKHFTVAGAYYPTDHVFAMVADAAAAQAGAARMADVPDVGAVQLAEPGALQQTFAKRAADVGGAPSVGREDQFMLRFVELARGGKAGLLIEVGRADTEALSAALAASGAVLAYYYRTLVIEELVDSSPRAEAAAAGKL